MSNQRLYKLTIVLVAVALLGLACGACSPTEEPAQLPAEQTTMPTEAPPAETPPTEVPPAETPPTEVPPAETPPTEVPPPPPEPPPVEAEQPTPCPEVKCLPNCFANNLAPAGGDGTEGSPWQGIAVDSQLTAAIECVAQEQGIDTSYLTVFTCSTGPQDCTGVLYKYEDGQWTSTQLEAATPVPQPGVPLPLAIVLVGVAVLGIVLLGSGILLRIRARTLRS